MARTNDSGIAIARTRDTRLRVVSIAAVFAMVAAVVLAGPFGTARAATQVGLGTAESFGVLAGTTITNTNATTITGDVGLYAGSAVTGFADVTILDGQLHRTDETASKAKDDLVVAYDSAAGQGPATVVAPGLGGQTLTGGVYTSAEGAFGITGTLTLDAKGTPSTVWIFQTTGDLITASDSSVSLVNGANPCNVFWQIGTSATLDTGTTFVGTIMALTSISLNTSARISGRALARNGAVTMDNNTITRPDCTDAVSPSPSPSPTSPSPSPSPSPTPPSPSPTPTSPSPSPDPTSTPTPTPTGQPSPPVVAGPADATTGTPDAATGTPDAATATPDAATGTPDAATGTPVAAGGPDSPVAATPPTSGAPQVPEVPTGSVGAGDGSMAVDETPERAPAALVLLSLLAAAALYATWRRRTA